MGYESTTMDDIAERADTARATVYNYYPRKSAFLEEWTERRRQRVLADLEQRGISAESPAAIIREYMQDLTQINLDEEVITRQLLPAWFRLGGLTNVPPVLAGVFAGYIRQGQKQGEFISDVDALLVGHLLRNAYVGTLAHWVSDHVDPGFDLVGAMQFNVEAVLRGVRHPC